MAKKVTEPDVLIYSPYYKGLKSKMPQEAKDQMRAEKPEHYESVFGETVPTPEVVE